MPVANVLTCTEVANLPTTATVDYVADPGSATVTRRVSITFSNKTTSDTTITLYRYASSTSFSIATAKKVAANDSLTISDIFLSNGRTLRMMAGAANAIDAVIDVVTRTET